MNWRRVRKGLLGIAAVMAFASAGPALAGDEALDKSMDKALEDLQPLLVGLVNADYEAALPKVESILEHVSRVTQMIPDSAKEKHDEYLAYAYNLRENAKILKSIVTTLVGEEKGAKGKGDASTEYLPVVAATHFGGIVDMCVACHNRFRIAVER